MKCYGKNLRKIKDDTKNVALDARKLLGPKIEALQSMAQNSIYANAHGDITRLKKDLRNSVSHVFGNHTLCQNYLCNKVIITGHFFNKCDKCVMNILGWRCVR